MNIDKYEELTGNTVAEDEKSKVTANIRRSRALLETLLGFTLTPKNLYNELGKTSQEIFCPDADISNLLPPDEVQGVYKLFPYNKLDKYFHVDPFTNIYAVKLVYVTTNYDFVTVKSFDGLDFSENVKAQYGREGIGKYIQRCPTCFFSCDCACKDCLQLAVDADWLKCYPDDIMYLWADMVDYYIDCNNNLKSESIDGHSYTKANTEAPETSPHNLLLLKRYAGPHGSVAVMPV